MFENMQQQPQHPASQQQQDQYSQQQGGYYDPYALPQDPYIQQRPSTNWNKQMLDKLLDDTITPADISRGEYSTMFRYLLLDIRRIPNLAPIDKRRMIRDYADIEGLIQCDGTRGMVHSRIRMMLLEVTAHSADGSSTLNGITGVSAIITQRNQVEQQVKVPQQTERKKIFGLI